MQGQAFSWTSSIKPYGLSGSKLLGLVVATPGKWPDNCN